MQFINAAHKHGVIILGRFISIINKIQPLNSYTILIYKGTFIVEFAKGSEILESILESQEKSKQVADSLCFVAKYCGFEGWLLNIECRVKKEKLKLLV